MVVVGVAASEEGITFSQQQQQKYVTTTSMMDCGGGGGGGLRLSPPSDGENMAPHAHVSSLPEQASSSLHNGGGATRRWRGSPTTLVELKQRWRQSCTRALHFHRLRTMAENRGLAQPPCPSKDVLRHLISSELHAVGGQLGVVVHMHGDEGAENSTITMSQSSAGGGGASGGAGGGGEEYFEEEDLLWEEDADMVLTGEDYVEMMRYIEQSWTRDLQSEEEALLEQYQEAMAFEDEKHTAIVNGAQEIPPGSVLCPVCTASPLLKNRNVLLCACGMRLDLQCDDITLEQFGRMMGEAHDTHRESGCRASPFCSVQSTYGSNMLMMLCSSCDFLHVVI